MLLGEKDRKITPPFQVHRVQFITSFSRPGFGKCFSFSSMALLLVTESTEEPHLLLSLGISEVSPSNTWSIRCGRAKSSLGWRKRRFSPKGQWERHHCAAAAPEHPWPAPHRLSISSPDSSFYTWGQENIYLSYIQLRRLKITEIITSLHDCLWTYVFCRSLMVKDWVVPQCAVSRSEMHWLFCSSWVEFIRSLTEFNEMQVLTLFNQSGNCSMTIVQERIV